MFFSLLPAPNKSFKLVNLLIFKNILFDLQKSEFMIWIN